MYMAWVVIWPATRNEEKEEGKEENIE